MDKSTKCMNKSSKCMNKSTECMNEVYLVPLKCTKALLVENLPVPECPILTLDSERGNLT